MYVLRLLPPQRCAEIQEVDRKKELLEGQNPGVSSFLGMGHCPRALRPALEELRRLDERRNELLGQSGTRPSPDDLPVICDKDAYGKGEVVERTFEMTVLLATARMEMAKWQEEWAQGKS